MVSWNRSSATALFPISLRISANTAGASNPYIAACAASSPARVRSISSSDIGMSASRLMNCLDARAGQKVATHMLPSPLPLYLRPRARVAELVDAADSDHQLSPRGEIPWVKPVKVGRGPEASRFELMPSQAPDLPGKV